MLSLLLIPGLNCTELLFAPQIAGLSDACDISVARHGRADDLAADARLILDEAPERFALCGLSMGGYLALEIVRQAPGRVSRLALLDSRAAPDTAADAERRHHLIDLAASGRFDEIHAILWPRLVRPAARGDAALEGIVREMMRATGAERFIRQQRAILSRPDFRPLLPRVIVPSLVLVGTQDVLTPPEHARAMAAAISGSRLVELPDCGHLSTLEQPDAVNAALRTWLAA